MIATIERYLSQVDPQVTMDAVRYAITHPTERTPVTLLVMLGLVILVVLVLLLAVILITPTRKKVVRVRTYAGGRPAVAESLNADDDEAGAQRPSGSPAARGTRSRSFIMAATSTLGISLIALVVVVGTYLATSTDAYCAGTCHAGSASVNSALTADHATCADCHEMDGVLAFAANVSSRGRMLVQDARGMNPAHATVSVDAAQCLSCHEDIADETVTSQAGLTMSHREVIEAGQPCRGCHARSGHSKDAFSASMSACLPCHDGVVASAECGTCHTRSPSSVAKTGADEAQLGSGDMVFPVVRATNRNCGGCHDQAKECDGCHGIRMPHSQDFIKGAHARSAAFRKKLACWNCHDPQWCSSGGCHRAAFYPQTGDTTHGSEWRRQHGGAGFKAGCVCHQGRTQRKDPICTLCHAPDRSLLAPIQ